MEESLGRIGHDGQVLYANQDHKVVDVIHQIPLFIQDLKK